MAYEDIKLLIDGEWRKGDGGGEDIINPATGEAIARTAAPMFKKLSLELGGKNPYIVCADADLDQAAERAVRRMVGVVADRIGIPRAVAYMFCSLAADLRITQTVNREKGVHMMIEKALLTRVSQDTRE